MTHAEKRKRHIGDIIKGTGYIRMTRERSKHLMKKMNAYGFNNYILREAKRFQRVILSDEYGTYEIPRTIFFTEGTYKEFKHEGFETQIFLSLDVIRKYTRPAIF